MIKQPVGFVKLTNVALIKYKVSGKKLEIACYKNKVIDWRNGLEKNISEVLQVEEIFSNAVQGELANKKLLQELFPGKTKNEIIAVILEKGEMQVSQKEREALQESTFKDIVNIISKKIVHPKSKKLFSAESIKAALKEVNFNRMISKSSKKQAQDGIRLLEKYFLVERVGLLVNLKFEAAADFEALKSQVAFEVQKLNDGEAIVIISPTEQKELDRLVQTQFKDKIEETILDNAFFNKETQSIDLGLETTLQRRDGVELPHHLPPDSDKKSHKKKKHGGEKGRQEDEEEVKKIVVGFDAMQIKMQEGKAKGSEDKVCSTCQNAIFGDLNDFKLHVKSEWHKFNLKRKLEKEPALGQKEFLDYELMKNFIKK